MGNAPGVENTGRFFVARSHRQHHFVSAVPLQKFHRQPGRGAPGGRRVRKVNTAAEIHARRRRLSCGLPPPGPCPRSIAPRPASQPPESPAGWGGHSDRLGAPRPALGAHHRRHLRTRDTAARDHATATSWHDTMQRSRIEKNEGVD